MSKDFFLPLSIGRDNTQTLKRGAVPEIGYTLGGLAATATTKTYARALKVVVDRFAVREDSLIPQTNHDLIVAGPMLMRGVHALREMLQEENSYRERRENQPAREVLKKAFSLEEELFSNLERLWEKGDTQSRREVLDFVDALSEEDHPAYRFGVHTSRHFLRGLLEDTKGEAGEVAVETLTTVAHYYITRQIVTENPPLEIRHEEDYAERLLRQDPAALLQRAGGDSEKRKQIMDTMLELEQTTDSGYGTWERVIDNTHFLKENPDGWEELLLGELGELVLPEREADRGHIIRALSAVIPDTEGYVNFSRNLQAFAADMQAADSLREILRQAFEDYPEQRRGDRRVNEPPYSPLSLASLANTPLAGMAPSEVDTVVQLVLGEYIGLKGWNNEHRADLSEARSEAELAVRIHDMITEGAAQMALDLGFVHYDRAPHDTEEALKRTYEIRETLSGVTGDQLIQHFVAKHILQPQLEVAS